MRIKQLPAGEGTERRFKIKLHVPDVARRIIGVREILVIVLVLVTGVFFSLRSPYFLTVSNITDMLRQACIIGIPAIGLTFVVTLGLWDLSQESMIAMGSVVSFQLIQRYGFSVWTTILLCCVLGVGMGAMNGIFVVKLRINSVIVTLATLGIWRGLSYICGKVDFRDLSSFVIADDTFLLLGNGYLFRIPVSVIIWFFIGAVGIILLRKHRIGRYVSAIGDSEIVAIQAGIRVDNVKFIIFVISGLLSAFCGIVITAWQSGIGSDPATGYIAPIITATLIGGTSLGGGYGTILGSILGAIFITMVKNGMNMLEISPYFQKMLEALLLIVALYVAFLQHRLRKKG